MPEIPNKNYGIMKPWYQVMDNLDDLNPQFAKREEVESLLVILQRSKTERTIMVNYIKRKIYAYTDSDMIKQLDAQDILSIVATKYLEGKYKWEKKSDNPFIRAFRGSIKKLINQLYKSLEYVINTYDSHKVYRVDFQDEVVTNKCFNKYQEHYESDISEIVEIIDKNFEKDVYAKKVFYEELTYGKDNQKIAEELGIDTNEVSNSKKRGKRIKESLKNNPIIRPRYQELSL